MPAWVTRPVPSDGHNSRAAAAGRCRRCIIYHSGDLSVCAVALLPRTPAVLVLPSSGFVRWLPRLHKDGHPLPTFWCDSCVCVGVGVSACVCVYFIVGNFVIFVFLYVPCLFLSGSYQFVDVHSATATAAAAEPVEKSPYAGQSSMLGRSSSSPAATRSAGVAGQGMTTGGGRGSNTVSELDKVEFSAWTGINAAEFGQVWIGWGGLGWARLWDMLYDWWTNVFGPMGDKADGRFTSVRAIVHCLSVVQKFCVGCGATSWVYVGGGVHRWTDSCT